jgi:Sugar-transfer associated ATP-grasp
MKISALVSDLRHYWSAPTHLPQIPVWRQMLEMATLYFLRRIGPNYYLQARWGRADLSFQHKWQHINRAQYRQLIFRLNPPAYRKISQHKLIEKSVLTLQHFPTPKFIAFVHAIRGKCVHGQPIRNAEQLSKLLTSYVNQRVCFKPVESFGGFGFSSYRITSDNGSIALLKKPHDAPLSLTEWWQANGQNADGFLLESYLEQHPDLAALNESSVNTIRMWVILDDNHWQVLGAYLRVGRQGSQVDNNSSGGIACPVDVVSGLVRCAFDPAQPGDSLLAHPDSLLPLVGFQIPFWQEACSIAGQAVAAFPHMRLSGLDMAMTAAGPSLIELNMMPEYIGCAWMDLPLKVYLHDKN